MLRDGEVVQDPSFVHEAGGFTYFGEEGLVNTNFRSPYTVKVASETLHMLCLPKRQLDSFLGRDTGLSSMDAVVAALKKSKHLSNLSDVDLRNVVGSAEEVTYNAGEVIAAANSSITNKIFLVKTGEVVLVPADVPLPGMSCGAWGGGVGGQCRSQASLPVVVLGAVGVACLQWVKSEL